VTKDSNFSVLFMRDGSDVKSFRVSPRRLKLLLWIAGVAALLVTIALAVGLRSFVGYRLLLNERRSLESSLAEAQVNLERLGNLDKIQKSQGKDAGAAKGPAADKASPATAQRVFSLVNTGAMTVENFRGQVGSQSVNVTFDLNNRGSGALSGDIRLLLLRNDGSLTTLDVPSQDLTYQIQRFKRISTSAPVPEGLTRREALGLRIEIKTSEGELIFGETYALGS
jgi:hypothetical protein